MIKTYTKKVIGGEIRGGGVKKPPPRRIGLTGVFLHMWRRVTEMQIMESDHETFTKTDHSLLGRV